MTDPCSLPDCVATREALARELAYRTLGGTPPPCDLDWANAALPAPPSATDPDAPQHRRPGYAGSRDHTDRTT